jgi:hypothetical protein
MLLSSKLGMRQTALATLRAGWRAAGDSAARYSGWAPRIAVAFLGLEFLLFRTSVATNIAPYYPFAFDQLAFCRAIYEAFLAVRDFGFDRLLHGPLQLHALLFRGWIVPVLGLLSAFVFGPNRLALSGVNFFFFGATQVLLWRVIRPRLGLRAVLIAEGLFLLSSAYYPSYIGGMHDLRLDFAAMATFGAAFMALVFLIETPSVPRLLLAVLCSAVTLSTRTITMVYFLGALGVLGAFFAIRSIVRKQVDERLRMVLWLAAAAAIGAGVFAALQWQGFDAYYVKLLRSGEGPMRDAQFGVHSPLERPLYFLLSAWDHFRHYAPFAVAAAAGLVLKWLLSGCRPAVGWSASTKASFGVFAATALATIAVLGSYSPSPVVIGVLTVPLVFALALLLVDALAWLPAPAFTLASCLVFTMGFGNYVSAMIAPGPMPYGTREEAGKINGIYVDIGRFAVTPNARVEWMFVDPALNDLAFYVYRVERGLEPFSAPPIGLSLVYASAPTIIDAIDQADVVVAPLTTTANGGFEYPYTTSLREQEHVWRPHLEEGFTRVGSYVLDGAGEIGLYIRQVRLTGVRNANGLERVDGRPFFWLGRGTTTLTLEAASAGRVTLAADIRPGASNPEALERHLRVSAALGAYDLAIPDSQRNLSFTIGVAAGANDVELRSLDRVTVPIFPNGDTRPLLLGVSGLHVAAFTARSDGER